VGRKAARTVEYFPHFVKFGKTLFLLEEKWGPDGFSFWFKLLMILGASTDHFLDCSKETRSGRENWEYLVARMRFPVQKCEEITAWLAERGNLDEQLWTTHRILWCQDFVNNITDVYSGRTGALPSRPFPGISGPETPSTGAYPANLSAVEGISGKSIPIGREGLKEGREEIPPSSATPSDPKRTAAELSTKADSVKENPMMIELMTIHRKATGGAELPSITTDEARELMTLYRRHGDAAVVAAYRLCQAKKPGKEMRWFLEDFGKYFAESQKPGKKEDPPCPECHATRGSHTGVCSRHPDNVAAAVSPPPPAPPPVAEVDTFEDDPLPGPIAPLFPEAT
jgi:hypothetical protein